MLNNTEGNPISPGQAKANEYISRIRGGESKEEILNGLPESFRSAIEAGLATPQEELSQDDVIVPPQYEGLPSDLLEEFMVVKEYIGDPERTQREKERKARALNYVREKEARQSEQEEDRISAGERVEEVRQNMGLSPSVEPSPEMIASSPYSKFKLSNGETDVGSFWYEYRNQAAKDLKDQGRFEWGKERIYFDVAIADMLKLRNIVMRVAAEHNIPIAFKFTDVGKTMASQMDGKETRFVANFDSAQTAKIFFDFLKDDSEYASLIPDRNMDYKGIRLDNMAEYASGYREIRGALERIMKANINPDGSYTYLAESGRPITISQEQYNVFKGQYDQIQARIEETKKNWGL